MDFRGQLKRIGPYVPMLLFSTACLSSASVVTLLVPGLLGRAVVSLPRLVVTDWTAIGLLLLGRAAFSFTGLYALGRVAARAIVDVRRQLFSRFVLATVAFHDRSWSAELVSTLTSAETIVHLRLECCGLSWRSTLHNKGIRPPTHFLAHGRPTVPTYRLRRGCLVGERPS